MIILRILKFLFNLLLGIILICFLPAVFKQFVGSVSDFFHYSWHPFALGTVLGLGIEKVLRHFVPWFHTLEHELTHALAGLPLGYIPVGINVTSDRGGYCKQICIISWFTPVTRHFVALAPYFLPTFTAIMAGFRPQASGTWRPWYDIGIGATFGYHTMSTVIEIFENYRIGFRNPDGRWQRVDTDIGLSGIIFSGVFIVVMTLAVHGLILAVIVRGYDGVLDDLRNIWTATYALAMPWVLKMIRNIR